MKLLIHILQTFFILLIIVYFSDIYEPIQIGSYWWIFLILFLSCLSIYGIGNVLAAIIGTNWAIIAIIVPGITLVSILLGNLGTPVKRLHILFQFISLFSTHRFMSEAIFLLQYSFDRCNSNEIQRTLYNLQINPAAEYFYYCLTMLIIHTIFFNVASIIILLFKMNSFENRKKRAKKISDFHQNNLANLKKNCITKF